MERLTLTLFGGFQARNPGGETLSISSKKAQALLAYLAMRPGQSHPRDKVASLLWPETNEDQSRHSLRQTLVVLRKAFPPEYTKSLLFDGDDLSVHPSFIDVDVAAFERHVAKGTVEALNEATSLYRGELLEGLILREEPFEEWLLAERERLWELALEALAKLLRHHMRSEDHQPAVQTAMRLLSLDPLQEAVHRTLMRLYLELGRREAALKQYQTCAAALQRELGIEPQPETKELYQQMLTTRPAWKNEVVERTDANQARTILVVEDDPVTRTLLEQFLTTAGYNVVAADDGAAALLHLGKRRFDAVLSDINMPNLSGLSLLEIMGRKGIDIPAIFITAMTGEELEVKGFELGAADFIRKPIRKDILLLRVKNALRRSRRATAIA